MAIGCRKFLKAHAFHDRFPGINGLRVSGAIQTLDKSRVTDPVEITCKGRGWKRRIKSVSPVRAEQHRELIAEITFVRLP